MKPTQIAKNAWKTAFEPWGETIRDELASPMLEEAGRELFGTRPTLDKRPKTIAQEELSRARNEQKLSERSEDDAKKSQESVQRTIATIRQEYHEQTTKTDNKQKELTEEFVELQAEVAKLAKVAGMETHAHLENAQGKIGIIDIKRLTRIVKFLRMKTEESKSANELVSQRSNAKRTTGMLAWVSGKQMKVHEQGTLTLQG